MLSPLASPCQRAFCNRGKRQGDSQRVVATRFTWQRPFCNRETMQIVNLSEMMKNLYMKQLRL